MRFSPLSRQSIDPGRRDGLSEFRKSDDESRPSLNFAIRIVACDHGRRARRSLAGRETIDVPGREVTKPVPQAERSLGSILSIRLWS